MLTFHSMHHRLLQICIYEMVWEVHAVEVVAAVKAMSIQGQRGLVMGNDRLQCFWRLRTCYITSYVASTFTDFEEE